MSSSSPGGAPSPEMEEDPMFVIKNLDTGLEMRIDDFERVANIATDEVQEHDPVHKKSGHLKKGTKALKHWTASTAKKAVSGIKDVAHELKMPGVLGKHKGPHSLEPSPSSSSRAGPTPLLSSAGFTDLLLRRSTTAESASQATEPVAGQSGSLASISGRSVSGSEVSAGSSQATRQPTASSLSDTSTGPLMAGSALLPGAAGAAGTAAAVPQLVPAASAPPGGPMHAASSSSTAAAAAAAGAAGAGNAAAAAAAGPAVPSVVRLVSHKRSVKQLEDVVLAQLLEGSCGVVWTVSFSRDGSFLAAAGQDGVLRVWQLTATRDKGLRSNWAYSAPAAKNSSTDAEHASQAGDNAAAGEQQQQQQAEQQDSSQHGPSGSGDQLQQPAAATTEQQQQEPQRQEALQDQSSADNEEQQQQQEQEQQPHPPLVEFGPYFSQQPVRQYMGHTEDVLDISWSSAGFILTASLDKSVRLWHVSQPECLREFWHTDFVTSVQFHPLDAQRFVSGSIDGKLRVWSITENAVLATAQLHQDMITAVGFSLNGGRVLAGTMRGRVRFYELADRKLEYVAQVDVRNQRGQHASGKKVTGICAVPGQPQQFLITTNDSRLRLLEGYGQILKFKGHKNSSTQIRAALSQDGAQVVCGSDDGWVYVWQHYAQGGSDRSRAAAAAAMDLLGGKNAVYQAFQAYEPNIPVTAVALAPPGVCDGRQASVMTGVAAAGGVGGSAVGAGGAVEGQWMGSRSFGGRAVQQLLVSGGFSGAIKVFELL